MSRFVSHPGQDGQVVVARVEDPNRDVLHSQRLGELKAKTCFLKVETLKPEELRR